MRAQLEAALAGRYTLAQELGHGGMAVVYHAHDLQHDRPIAIKVLRPELATALGPDRFVREIKLTASLNHPHILPLLDSGVAGQRGGPEIFWYVMPLVEGESLRARLDREQQLPIPEAVRIAREVADALDHSHGRGIVHRDIKPENILLQAGHALVADFGIARAIDRAGGAKLTETGLSIGTPSYMSPEQGTGGEVDGRTDIYALGCVLYEMLAGAPPFTGPTAQGILARHAVDPVPSLRTVRPVSTRLEAIIRTALAKVPADRFATASAFATALAGDAVLDDSPASLPGARKARRWLLPAALAVIVLAGGGSWLALRGRGPRVIPQAEVIAVLPFAPATPDSGLATLGFSLASTVAASLDGVGELRTVDRLTILGQTQRQQGILSLEDGAALGRRFGARSVVYGSMSRQGSDVRLDIDLVTTDSLAYLTRVVVTAPADSVAALTDSITWKLLREVWRGGQPPSPSLAAITTRSVPALRAFLDAEKLLVQGRMDSAAATYRVAFTTDTTFWLAYFRYAYVFDWTEGSGADSMADVAWAHRGDLPERERALLELAHDNSSISAILARSRAYTTRYPDYWPGWFQYADYMTHDGGRLGHGLDEIDATLERAASLNPNLFFAWDHLLFMAILNDDSATARRAVEGMARIGGGRIHYEDDPLDYYPGYRLVLATAGSYPALDGPLLDSVARMISATRVAPAWPLAMGFSILGLPKAQIELNRRVIRRGTSPEVANALRPHIAAAWAARGAWDSAMAEQERFVSASESGASAFPTIMAYREAVTGVCLGALDSAVAAGWRERAHRALDRYPGSASPRWPTSLDGLLAAAEGDRAGVRRARLTLRGDTSSVSRSDQRALAAFDLALERKYREAADSLSALIGEYADGTLNLGGNDRDALYRLATSRWLLDAGDTVAAIAPIRDPAANYGPQHVVFDGPTYFQLATLLDATGRHDEAEPAYRKFLARYDMPVPALRGMVEQARSALTRLSRTGDTPAAP